jgi:OpgC protein
MKRLVICDSLRGIMLLMMIVDHSPSQLRLFTDQPMGFSTTAEGFVFVSAFLAGMIFRRRTDKAGFAAAGSATIYRAWRIYRAHLLTVFFAFVIGSFFLGGLPGVGNLLDQYLKNPANVYLVFVPNAVGILSGATMGMESRDLYESCGVAYLADASARLVSNCFRRDSLCRTWTV